MNMNRKDQAMGLAIAAAMLAVPGMPQVFPASVSREKPTKRVTEADLSRIEAAKAKRDRKAAQRAAQKGQP